MSFDGITIVLGVLGSYFAILLVLSVSVERTLEPLYWFRGLRKQASPDEVLESVEEWLPDGSDSARKVIAIQTFTSQTKTNIDKLEKSVSILRDGAVKALTDLGLEEQLDTVQKDIALKMSALRQQHHVREKNRVTLLRVISALVGILIASLMQINTFEILGILFPENVLRSLSTPVGQVGGIILTGLASSAGSSFWHDMLGRVRDLKELAKQTEGATSNTGKGGGGGVG